MNLHNTFNMFTLQHYWTSRIFSLYYKYLLSSAWARNWNRLCHQRSWWESTWPDNISLCHVSDEFWKAGEESFCIVANDVSMLCICPKRRVTRPCTFVWYWQTEPKSIPVMFVIEYRSVWMFWNDTSAFWLAVYFFTYCAYDEWIFRDNSKMNSQFKHVWL